MARCTTCGNDYERSFEVTLDSKTYPFDCFECAIHMLAPTCATCGCRVIGHGVQLGDQVFCCDHCARAEQRVERDAGTTTQRAGAR
ncbi:hypothetical protein [Enhygromyxa salina]|uniref:Prokaryotic metallothionein n=1 Tax=Enhygromyxa salina TaxID=215803 RepID=A0A2S9YHK1_9BACT|nr:hypothetical protein [Enhygromyxa salina]PRQ04588.1 hypothetical protein ENSA7_50790 [Enhygromyxa salina]